MAGGIVGTAKLPNCPNCESSSIFVLKEWGYRRFHVKNIKCSSCNISFKAYYRREEFSHIIVNATCSNPEIGVPQYLRKHGALSEGDIAGAFHLTVGDVRKVLQDLKKKGIVESVDAA